MNTMYISGRIGNKEIAKDDIQHFVQSIKDFEWTANNIYKPAKVVDVKPTFYKGNNFNEDNYIPQSLNLNEQFQIEESSHLYDFQQYKTQCEDRKFQQLSHIAQQRNDFIKNFFPNGNLSEDSEKKEIIDQIKLNLTKIVLNSNLNSKLGNYIGYLNNVQNAGYGYSNNNSGSGIINNIPKYN